MAPTPGSTCRLVYGAGDCREANGCNGVGTCVDGLCVCPPGYIDSNCSQKLECRYWDANASAWSTQGVVSTLSADGLGLSCDTVHLTNFGGVLNIPTSVEELLEELKEAFTFSTFTLDEAFALLANFDFGKNVTISLLLTGLLLLDALSLIFLGYYRGYRARLRRRREQTRFAAEVEEDTLKQMETRANNNKSTKRVGFRGDSASPARPCTSAAPSMPVKTPGLEEVSEAAPKPSQIWNEAGKRRHEREEFRKRALDYMQKQPQTQDSDEDDARFERRSLLTQRGWLFLIFGCFVCPGINLLALCFCRETRTVRVSGKAAPYGGKVVAFCRRVAIDFCLRCMTLSRNEHTVINLVSPPDDEDALQPAQIIQLFFNTLSTELFVVCFQHKQDDDDGEGAYSGNTGGRRGGATAEAMEGNDGDLAASLSDNLALSPITAIFEGGIAAAMTITIVTTCGYAFRWSNSRYRKPPSNIVRKVVGWLCQKRGKQPQGGDNIVDEAAAARIAQPDGSEQEACSKAESGCTVHEEAATDVYGEGAQAPAAARRVPRKIVQYVENSPCTYAETKIAQHVKASICDGTERMPASASCSPTGLLNSTSPKSASNSCKRRGAKLATPDGFHLYVSPNRQTISNIAAELGVTTSQIVAWNTATYQFLTDKSIVSANTRLRYRLPLLQSKSPHVVARLEVGLPAATIATPIQGRRWRRAPILASSFSLSPPPSPPEGHHSRVAWTIGTGDRPPFGFRTLASRSMAHASRMRTGKASAKVAPAEGQTTSRGGLSACHGRRKLPTCSVPKPTLSIPNPIAAVAAGNLPMPRLPLALPKSDLTVDVKRWRARTNADAQDGAGREDFGTVVFQAQLAKKKEDLALRGPNERRCRACLAWTFNLTVLMVMCMVSLVFGAKFGEQQMNQICIGWLVAYGWTIALVEPVIILIMACAPCFMDERTRLGRVCSRLRRVYVELCAP